MNLSHDVIHQALPYRYCSISSTHTQSFCSLFLFNILKAMTVHLYYCCPVPYLLYKSAFFISDMNVTDFIHFQEKLAGMKPPTMPLYTSYFYTFCIHIYQTKQVSQHIAQSHSRLMMCR